MQIRDLNDILVLLQPQVFRYYQNLLSVLIWSKHLSTFADDKNAKICIEKTKEIVGVADNVASLVARRDNSQITNNDNENNTRTG